MRKIKYHTSFRCWLLSFSFSSFHRWRWNFLFFQKKRHHPEMSLSLFFCVCETVVGELHQDNLSRFLHFFFMFETWKWNWRVFFTQTIFFHPVSCKKNKLCLDSLWRTKIFWKTYFRRKLSGEKSLQFKSCCNKIGFQNSFLKFFPIFFSQMKQRCRSLQSELEAFPDCHT